jgi:hypothetical protein
MGMGQFFPSGYGYGFVCPLGTLPTAIPNAGAAPRLASSSILAWMTKILEAERGVEAATWLALPTVKLEVTILGDHRRRGATRLHDENP